MATSITNTSVTTDNLTVDALTVDANTLYVDATNDHLGVNTTNPAQYASSGNVLNVASTETTNVEPSIIKMSGRSATGAGFVQTEVYGITSVSSNTEISRITGTGTNGMRMLVEAKACGHTGSLGNAHFIARWYWDGTSNAPVLMHKEHEAIQSINITATCPSAHVMVIGLTSSDGSQPFNGVMEVKYYVPIDFAGNTWTTS